MSYAGLALFGVLGMAALGPARLDHTPWNRPPAALPAPTATQQVATFAGGCFWSMQKAFDGVAGVASVTAGYAGGSQADPSYNVVETGRTGYAESVQVIYDPSRISYD